MIRSVSNRLIWGYHFQNQHFSMNKIQKTNTMISINKIDAFVSKLQHPMKAEIVEIIKIFRGASKDLEEDVKWGGPSFDYKEPMATLSLRVANTIIFIFHKGELIKHNRGLLEPAPKGKAYLKLHSMEEIRDNKENIQSIVKEWIKLMNDQ